jgi:hypothetical protein
MSISFNDPLSEQLEWYNFIISLLILNNEQFDTFLVQMWQGIEMAMSQKLLLNPKKNQNNERTIAALIVCM